jgi:hypothetical protein
MKSPLAILGSRSCAGRIEVPVTRATQASPARAVPVQELELDLAARDVDITRHDHARSLRILLRVRGAPAGWLRLQNPAQVDRAELVHLATVRLGDNTLAVALRDNLSPDFELPPVSVAVCTRERQQSLQRCIEALIALDYPRFEIIIVDNARISDATERLVATFANDRIRYVREDRQGRDWARNCALAAAKHDIRAFTGARAARGVAVGGDSGAPAQRRHLTHQFLEPCPHGHRGRVQRMLDGGLLFVTDRVPSGRPRGTAGA